MEIEFDTSPATFPIKEHGVFLAHCGISPLYSGAARAARRFDELHMIKGGAVFAEYGDILGGLRQSVGTFLGVDGKDVAFLKNTAEGLSLIAAGYPFEQGDQIISYVHEYPSNHYPWRVQTDRGVELVLLGNRDMQREAADERKAHERNTRGRQASERPIGFDLQELAGLLTDRTRIVTLSHVQFTSGFAADLAALGQLCRDRGVHLVVDAAQSLGCLPLRPAEWHIDAVAASGWKWLLGPIGTGVLYTSPEFRAKLAHRMAGADSVLQGDEYLNHSWQPHTDARRFEYSTAPVSLALALQACFDELLLRYGIEAIHARGRQLRQRLLDLLDPGYFRSLDFPERHQSGILSFVLPADRDPLAFVGQARRAGVMLSSRGGYLRMAPHFCTQEAELDRAARILNELSVRDFSG
jgi:selenocysteine lyase/cysteine desulfurase